MPRSPVPLLGALTGLTALSIDMSLPALPTLAAVFSTSAEQAALTLSMFLAGYPASQLFYGTLSDRFGRRPPLLLGLILFAAGGVAMVICAALRLGEVAGIVGPILLYLLGMSLVTPHAIAAAMQPVPHMAGFAASLIGALQTAGGALVAYIVGALYNRTALPLALGVGIPAVLAGITCFIFLGRLAAVASPGHGDVEC
jgi:DHA1 family bicyclomycin/chloramphenicol resistance-like MFS transporter